MGGPGHGGNNTASSCGDKAKALSLVFSGARLYITFRPVLAFRVRYVTPVLQRLALVLVVTASVVRAEEAPWRSLFDGSDLAAWQAYYGGGEPRWVVEDGTLAWRPRCGDLATREDFGDFELELEWRISEGGNSGIFLRADPAAGPPFHTGVEMQVLDDARHRDGGSRLTAAGSNYGLHPAPEGAVKPAGAWNHVRILAQGNRMQFFLNGVPTVDMELGGEDWQRRIAGTKFADWPRFGRTTTGRIVLQDHGNPVWYRNIRIRDLTSTPTP